MTVDEEFDASPLRDLHQASQAAHASGAPLDTSVVGGWGEVERKVQSLADEVQQATPAALFDAAAAAHRQGPSSATQMEQLQCITKVQGAHHASVSIWCAAAAAHYASAIPSVQLSRCSYTKVWS